MALLIWYYNVITATILFLSVHNTILW